MSDNDESLTVTRAGIVARGLGVYAILSVLAVIAAILYSGWETKQAVAQLGATMTAEHHSLRLAQDKTSCILALTIEERAAFRLRYQQGSFRQWCPWMGE